MAIRGTLLLGIDLGTSSAKAVLVDAETLTPRASAAREYPVLGPKPGYAEQHPDDWWAAVCGAVRDATADANTQDIAGIGVAGQMHGLVTLGADGEPLENAIIWADGRSAASVEALARFQQASERVFPGPPAAGFAAASAHWLSQHDPARLAQTHLCLSPKDEIRRRLTGTAGTEASDASATGLYDLLADDWSAEALAFCGLRAEQMPSVTASEAVVGALTSAGAGALGLPAGIPVVAGGADLPTGALGMGLAAPGDVLVTVGTGGQVMSPLAHPTPDPAGRYYTFRHVAPGLWYAQAAMLAAGLSLRWLRDVVGWGDDAYTRLSELAAGVPPGAEGLLFLPYLAGERAPHTDPHASGGFFGLRLHHGLGHMARAVMEGVGFGLADCLALVSPNAQTITLSGGAAASGVWRQILADIWNCPVQVADSTVPHTPLGAALLAGVGVGAYANLQDALSRIPAAALTVTPNAPDAYAERYAQYRRLYPLLREEMHALHSAN